MIAHVCDLQVGDFVHTFGDLHIYQNHLDQVKILLEREPLELPRLRLVGAENKTGLDGLLSLSFENFELEDYRAHKKIAAPVAV